MTTLLVAHDERHHLELVLAVGRLAVLLALLVRFVRDLPLLDHVVDHAQVWIHLALLFRVGGWGVSIGQLLSLQGRA